MPVGVPNEYNPATGEINAFPQPVNKATVATAALVSKEQWKRKGARNVECLGKKCKIEEIVSER